MKINKIVQRSFNQLDNIGISNRIEQRGGSVLVTAVYDIEESIKRNFYKKPKLAQGDETKLAILYGETMITPYIIDVGSSSGANDPASIQKTIRFIAGDGDTEGVVIGPNGTPLENIYIGGADEQPQPIIDSDGRPSTKDIIYGSVLGGVVQSAPAIWDAIFNDDDKVADVDPITGGKILSKSEKELQKTVGGVLSIDDLSDVYSTDKGDDYILVYEACSGKWIAKHISQLLADANSITQTGGTAATAATPGDPGTAGTPAWPGIPPTEETIVTPPIPELPDTDPNKATGAIATPLGLLAELKDISETIDNEYYEEVNVLNTTGITLHFEFEALASDEEFNPTNASEPASDFPCLINDSITGSEAVSSSSQSGTVEIEICLSLDICGTDYVFYESTYTKTGTSFFAFTDNHVIDFYTTKLGELLTNYPDQVINEASPNIKVRLRRVDGVDTLGTPKSSYPVSLEGYSFTYYTVELEEEQGGIDFDAGPNVTNDTLELITDDSLYPEVGAGTSVLQAVTCPTAPTIFPGQPGSDPIPAVPAVPATAGTPGTDGTPASIAIDPPPAVPKLVLKAPLNGSYTPDELLLPLSTNAVEIDSIVTNVVDPNVTVKYEMLATANTKTLGGSATFVTAAMPAGVTATPLNGNRVLTLSGPAADMPAASQAVSIQPAIGAQGDIIYQVNGVNGEGQCSGGILKLVPTTTAITASKAAEAYITFDTDTNDTGFAAVLVTMPTSTSASFVEKYLTFIDEEKLVGQTDAQFALAVKANIDNNVATANALPVTDPLWLPAFTTETDGAKLIIRAPRAGGEDFNGFEISGEYSGDVATDGFASLLGFFGGVTKTVSDFVLDTASGDGAFGEIGGVLTSIVGYAAGAAASNILFNNASSLSISIPESDADVDVAFLYRGRRVQVPTEYSGELRTGAPTYDAWLGTFKKEWTSNPAWCLLDFIDNKKFGLGNELTFTTAQRELLLRDIFAVAEYCDELDPTEPRFSLNTAITDGSKLQVLEQLCSVFNGSYVFYNGTLRISYDHPDTEIRLLVNQANTSGLVYEHSTLKSFINKVVATYVEPDKFYTEATVAVENSFGINKYGEKAISVFAFGCTSRDQAIRYASWVLNTELANSLIISYTAGWDHYNLVPGSIVEFSDSNEEGSRRGGRVKLVSGLNVTLDADTDFIQGDNISITMDNGEIHQALIATKTSATELILDTAPSNTASKNNTFITSVTRQLYKVVKINENSEGIYSATLQIYDVDKYNKI